jgi:YD repeat-containing protein
MLIRRLLCSALIACGLSIPLAASQSGVNYIYDDLGRLIGVVDPNGNSAVYHYDAVGNVTSIDRYTAAQIVVISFSPSSGAIGSTVTIRGSGFSATASQNTVTFNGTAATVSSATTTQLVVSVPAGATTGAIGVTAPAGSSTSSGSFVVTTGSLAPTITGFTPTAGVAGTSVTITGTNFDTVLSNDRTRFNVAYAALSSGTASALTALVPSSTGSGRISVSTPSGTATSTSDFIIPPSPYVAGDVQVSGRLPFATATTVTISTAGKIGLMLFDGSPGQRVSLKGTNGLSGQIFGCDVFARLLNPNTTTLASDTCMELSGFIDVTTLPATGTYTVLVDPAGTATGSLTLTLYDVPADVSGSITAGGSAVTLTTTTPGQNGKLTFSGTSGQRISLKGTNGMTAQVLGCDVNVTILNPDSTVLAAATCMEGSGFIDVKTLPTTGTYTIKVDPVDIATGSLTLTLYNVPADLTPTIAPGGAAVTVTTTTPGQNARLTFSGTSGQRIFLKGTNGMSGQVLGCDVNVTILNPDSSTLAAATCMELSGFIDVKTLPATGTYTINVDPVDVAVGSLTLTLYDVPADTTGTITPGGSPVTVTTTTPGQNGTLTFSGTAGQRISLNGTNGMTGQVAFACDVNVSILNPDSSVLAAATCMEGSGFIDVKPLAATGTYTIKIDPAEIATGSVTLTLYDVPADPSTVLTVGGPSATLTTTTPGQNAQATFSGTSGQQITVHVTGNTMGSVTVKLLKPDGSQLTSTTSSAASFNLATQTLATTGTYTIVIDPGGVNTGAITLNVTNP